MKQCKLCGKERKLCKSHIIPEFFYKPLYDEKHRFFSTTIENSSKNIFEQKGIRERLLCKECEKYFSKFETYVSLMFKNKVVQRKKNVLLFEDIDYRKFKLFQLSILWRFLISESEMTKSVKFPTIEPKIRRMLIEENPGKYNEFGCLIMFIIKEKNETFTDMIYSPVVLDISCYKYIRVLFGGILWIFSLQHFDEGDFKNYFIKEDNTLRALLKKINEVEFLKSISIN